MPKIIFLGNGPLAEYTLGVLEQNFDIIFRAKSADDLERVKELKQENPDAIAILASFGVLIKSDLLELFEPEGIINLHPSLLPDLRGATPIETAILRGDTDFSYSIMKLAKAMDAGPIYHQETLTGLPLDKFAIYKALAEAGAAWLVDNLDFIHDIKPVVQDDAKATFCEKFDKTMSMLSPEELSAADLLRHIVAYQNYPKPKLVIAGLTCIIHAAHLAEPGESAPIEILCADGKKVIIDSLQPEGRKIMTSDAFKNGYMK